MAEEEFEVRGAHEHAVEHMAEARAPLGQTIALFSAVLATAGAGGRTACDQGRADARAAITPPGTSA